MYQGKYYISPRVQVQQARDGYTSNPLSKVEHDSFVSANRLAGNHDKLKRYVDDAVRFALDELAESI
jgi:hypothetical protein